MLYKILHYISKYNLMLLVYFFILFVSNKLIGFSYISFILTTLIYIILIYKKILTFSSTWLNGR